MESARLKIANKYVLLQDFSEPLLCAPNKEDVLDREPFFTELLSC